MTAHTLDTTGLKCPQPVLKIATKAPDVPPGDVLEVVGACATFERDVHTWCERMNRALCP